MDKLNKISPELSKIKKENSFGVPENYFDDFSARLHTKLEAEKQIVPERKNRFIQFLKPAFGLAASFTLIFVLVYWPLKTFMPNQVVEISETEIDITETEYLAYMEGIDENSFYSMLEEPAQSVKFSDEDLISYVNTNVSEYEIYLATNF